MSRLSPLMLALSLPSLIACQTPAQQAPSAAEAVVEREAQGPQIQSDDILAREQQTETASVKHVLISWDALGPTLQGRHDPRAAERTQAEAAALIRDIQQEYEDGADFSTLMALYSEDGGSAKSGRAYDVTRDGDLAFMFKRLSLRLRPGETGIVETPFGYHLILRLE
ncbi:MAG TPA: peptidylprolyl isomerase [Myxococcaceae bacterium]|nr:peptidylprolyl isomerase [Myxococcaceae bacterium]